MPHQTLAGLEPQSRSALLAQAHRDLARRAVPGAMVYFLVVLVAVAVTPYDTDHPVILFSAGSLMLLVGGTRMIAAMRLSSSTAETLFRWKNWLRFLILSQFTLWGVFCAVTLALYGTEWTAMLVLFCTSALAGGGTSSLAPDSKLAAACLPAIISPAAIVAAVQGTPESYSITFLSCLYLGFLLLQARQHSDSYRTTSEAAAMEAARESDKLFRAAFEDAGVGMALAGTDGGFLRVNDELREMLGRPGKELLATDLVSLSHPDDADISREVLQRLKEGENKVHFEQRYVQKQGADVWVSVNISAVGSEQAEYRYYVLMLQNIGERKAAEQEKEKMEDRLRQSQKLEAIGKLAGGIAHDFNNVLAVIMSCAELSLEELGPRGPARETVSSILSAAERAAELTKRLLAFSRRQVLQPAVVSLNEIISEMEDWLRRTIGEDINLVLDLEDDLGAVCVDSAQMQQVLLNLAVNARDAMPDGGRLMITTANASPVWARTQNPAQAADPQVLLIVADTGHCMTAATRSHVFEPFFTTKEPGQGTGLGLATVYGIIQQCQGTIDLSSQTGGGTQFEIRLPNAGTPPARVVETNGEKAPRGSEHILLVEDEEGLRRMVKRILESQGYVVLDAGDASQALELLNQHDGSLDLLLTDVIMPGMSGAELAEKLRHERPGLKVIYMSAYAGDKIARHGVVAPDVELIEKPFKSKTLLNRVRAVLDRPR